MKKLNAFVAELRAGGNPYARIRAERAAAAAATAGGGAGAVSKGKGKEVEKVVAEVAAA